MSKWLGINNITEGKLSWNLGLSEFRPNKS